MSLIAFNSALIEPFDNDIKPLTISVENPNKFDETIIDNKQRELIIDNIMKNVSDDIKAGITSSDGKYYHYFTHIPNHLIIYIPLNLFSTINADNLHTITYNSAAYESSVSIKADEPINIKFQKFLSIIERNLASIYENIEVIDDNKVSFKDEGLVDTNLMFRKLNVPGYTRQLNISKQLTDDEKNLIMKRLDDESFDDFTYLDLIRIAKQKTLTPQELDMIYSKIKDYRFQLFDEMIKSKDNANIAEYNRIKDLLKSGDLSNDLSNVYSEVIQKEQSILDLANQLAKNEQTKKIESKYFMNKSLYDIFIGIFITMKDIINFLTNNQITYNSFITFLNNKHRMIYLGIIVIILGIILNLVL